MPVEGDWKNRAVSSTEEGIAVFAVCCGTLIFIGTLLTIISKHFWDGFASKTPFIRYPVLGYFILSFLTILGVIITQLIDVFTDLYDDEPCAVTHTFVCFILARLSMYYFWLGRLYTVFKGSTWEVPFSTTRNIAITMAITSLLSSSLYFSLQLPNGCSLRGTLHTFFTFCGELCTVHFACARTLVPPSHAYLLTIVLTFSRSDRAWTPCGIVNNIP